MRQPPHAMDETLDLVAQFREQLAPFIDSLPPTPAKELVEHLHAETASLIDQVRTAYPDAIVALEQQEKAAEDMLVEAKRHLAEAEQRLANVPPPEQIRKSFMPPPADLPAGLGLSLDAEMRQRYAPPVAPPIVDPEQPAAWQDWSLS